MGQEKSISALRSRVSALVEQESHLLTQAFELSRNGGDRRAVDALFAQVQGIQVERNSLKREIGCMLGTQRMHAAAEVWKPGAYEYREEVGGPVVRVHVAQGPLGLEVHMPGRKQPVRIESLEGSFDGPLAGDSGAGCHLGDPPESAKPAARSPKKKRT